MTKNIRITHNTFIDNVYGYGSAIQVNGWDQSSDYSEIIVEFNDNVVYGESEAEDCPADGSFCKPV